MESNYGTIESGGISERKSATSKQYGRFEMLYGIPLLVIACIAAITISTLQFSRPFKANDSKFGDSRSSLAIIHESLNLFPDDAGRYEYSNLSDDAKQLLFEAYTTAYNRNYSDDDMRIKRFKAFSKSLSNANKRNEKEKKLGGSAVHGITKFSDLSDDEFREQFLRASPNFTSAAKANSGSRLLSDTSDESKSSSSSLSKDKSKDNSNKNDKTFDGKLSDKKEDNSNEKEEGAAESDVISDLPSSVDWEGIYVTSVKDQGYCGACWAFAVTEQLESDGIRLGLYGIDIDLAPQQIISCDTEAVGCSGGWTESAWNYVAASGLSTSSSYPFTAYLEKEMSDESAVCQLNEISSLVTVAGYYTLASEEAMVEYVKSTGPLSICVDSTEWNSYIKGIVNTCPSNANHCVQAVGVTTSKDGGFWKVCKW